MKKFAIGLFAILICLSVLPATAFASEAVSDVYLFNPVSVACNENFLAVADIITDSQSLLHFFDVSTNQPTLKETLQVDGKIVCATAANGDFYVALTDKVVKYTESQGKFVQSETFEITNVVAMTLRGDGKLMYATSDGTIRLNGTQGSFAKYDKVVQLVATGETGTAWLYVSGGASNFRTHNGVTMNDDEQNLVANETGMLLVDGKIVFYDLHSFYSTDEKPLFVAEENKTIVASCAIGQNVYVAQSDKTISKWIISGEVAQKDASFAIGSDTVSAEIPQISQFDSYTLATATGYPANVIYKTTGEGSVDEIINNAEKIEFVVLGYDGEDPSYYYVYVNGKFGWIKKSAETLVQDANLKVIDNSVSTDEVIYTGKVMSARAVYVYYLPCAASQLDDENLRKEIFVQSPETAVVVEIFSRYTATDGSEWYFVGYGDKTGFLQKNAVGTLKSHASENAEIVLDPTNPFMKVNASLHDSVNMYLTSDLDEEQLLCNENDEQIKLETGTRVNVIRYEQDAAYVQVVNSDNTQYFGWVAQTYLIDLNALTTNAIVGIVLMFAAIALLSVAFVLYHNKKRQKDATSEEDDH